MTGAERAAGTGNIPRGADGAATASRDGAPEGDEADTLRPGGRGRRIALIAGIACALAILIGLGAALIAAAAPPDRSSPESTVTGYYTALKAQDYSLAWQFDADSHNNTSTENGFISDRRSDDEQYGRVTAFTVAPAQTESATQATVEVSITRTGSGGTVTTSYTVALTQYGGDTWLINTITAT